MSHRVLSTGLVLRSARGREMSPAPGIDCMTLRKTTLTLARVRAWLRVEAHAEAVAHGDEFAADQFAMMDPKNLSQCDMDTLNDYLWER